MVESLKKLHQDRKKCDRDRKSFKSVTNTLKSDTTREKLCLIVKNHFKKLTFFHSTHLFRLQIADLYFLLAYQKSLKTGTLINILS